MSGVCLTSYFYSEKWSFEQENLMPVIATAEGIEGNLQKRNLDLELT